MKRNATALWNGTGKDGKGNLTTQSGVLCETQYSYTSRFEDGIGTNPEELVAAAHAGCFTMKLAFNLQKENFVPTSLETKCTITLENGAITESKLELKAQVPGIDITKFDELVKDAEANCPISKLLDTSIVVTYELESIDAS
jgi:lipoyl-dependent peroxiredoxin